jgi:UDP-glucose 4-epimerase
MKALVTGGMGFIGSHLCEALLEGGHDVTVIDDLTTGRRENLARVEGDPRLQCCVGTIRDDHLMRRLLDGVDIVFHLAAVVGVRRVLESPLRCLDTNIRGTDMLFELAAERGVKVMLASSSEIYGRNGSGPLTETHSRLLGSTSVPRWIYSATKAIDEYLALGYWQEKRHPSVIMRFFNIVGPRQTGQYGMVLPTFVRQALAGEPLRVYGDGQQTRSFTYVSDAVRATIALMQSPQAIGEAFNVGSEEVTTIEGLAHRVKELAGSESPVQTVAYEEAFGEDFEEPRDRAPDIGKLRACIGYEPQVTLDEMIRRTIAYHRGEGMAGLTIPVRQEPGMARSEG